MRQLDEILVASSLDEGSDSPLRTALQITRQANSRLHLVHAFMPPVAYGGTYYGLAQVRKEIFEADYRREEARLARQFQRVDLGDVDVNVRLEFGSAHRLVLETADFLPADLIVLGAAESNGPRHHLLGSTADRVLRKATCPVLVVRGEMDLPPKRVLIPVDLSPISEECLEEGLRLLTRLCGQNAPEVEALVVVSAEEFGASSNDAQQAVDQTVHENLQKLVRRVDPEDLLKVRTEIRRGIPREEILHELDRTESDLVILGTHGRHGFERLMMGSVASYVSRHAATSVLVVPPSEGLRDETLAARVAVDRAYSPPPANVV